MNNLGLEGPSFHWVLSRCKYSFVYCWFSSFIFWVGYIMGLTYLQIYGYHFYAFSTHFICFCCKPLSILESLVPNANWLCAKVLWGEVHRSQLVCCARATPVRVLRVDKQKKLKNTHQTLHNARKLCCARQFQWAAFFCGGWKPSNCQQPSQKQQTHE